MPSKCHRKEASLLCLIVFICEAILSAGSFCRGRLECQMALKGKMIMRSGVLLCTKKHQFTCVDQVCVCGRPEKCNQ